MSLAPLKIMANQADRLAMEKHLVNWRTVTEKTIYGRDFQSRLPRIIDCKYRRTLLAHILAMPKKYPISFGNAVCMAGQKSFEADKVGYEIGQSEWYLAHFVEWISSLGYHIELTGNEFELYAVSNKIA